MASYDAASQPAHRLTCREDEEAQIVLPFLYRCPNMGNNVQAAIGRVCSNKPNHQCIIEGARGRQTITR
jgi:hypothetical protein